MIESNCRRWMVLSERDATAEPLNELERQWYAQHAATCSDCAGEVRFWAALGEVTAKPDVLKSNLLSLSVSRVPPPRGRGWARLRPFSGWLLAAAASTVLVVAGVVAGGLWLRQRPKVAASLAVAPAIRFVAVTGEARLGSKSIRAGDAFVPGERLRTEQGRVCFSVELGVLSCLDANGEVTLSSSDSNFVSVRLERGRLMSQLERQPAERRYVVLTSKASVTAKCTQFVVGVDAEQRVSVHLHEGQLAIQSLAHQNRDMLAPSAVIIEETISDEGWSERVVTADREMLQLAHLLHHAQLVDNPMELDVMTRPLGASVRIDDMLLGLTPAVASLRGGHRLVVSMPGYATVTELLPTQPGERLQRNYELAELPVAMGTAAGEPIVNGIEPATVGETNASSKPKGAPATAPITPRGLLARAQALRAAGRLSDCVSVYRQLVGSFASSDEARVALISLGELELGTLGQPAQALHSFENYLQQPGPLTREARFGRIRALKALSRKADAATAIAAFLRDYPNSVQAERLRRRLPSR